MQNNEGPNLARREQLVVFDFDDTIYAHTKFQRPNSCHINEPPLFELADRSFLERALKHLIGAGIHVGVASFGKKSVIIDTMNALLYGKSKKPADPQQQPYFNGSNVVTVPDVEHFWKKALEKISATFKKYISSSDGDVDKAFAKFQREQRPQNEAKYFCIKLEPEAKIQMIQILCDHYQIKDRTFVRFFDDDISIVEAALKRGIMAHLVPAPGFTEAWWRTQCEPLKACRQYALEDDPHEETSTLKKSRTENAVL